jgi:hypothetical protein
MFGSVLEVDQGAFGGGVRHRDTMALANRDGSGAAAGQSCRDTISGLAAAPARSRTATVADGIKPRAGGANPSRRMVRRSTPDKLFGDPLTLICSILVLGST